MAVLKLYKFYDQNEHLIFEQMMADLSLVIPCEITITIPSKKKRIELLVIQQKICIQENQPPIVEVTGFVADDV